MGMTHDWLGLNGKTAVVTGGAAGIGRACCEALAEVGARVVIADVNEEAGLELGERLQDRYGAETVFVNTDVSNRSSVDGMVAAAVASFGALDVLVNNAGILIPRLLVDPAGREELTEAILDTMIAVNMKGMFLCAQAAARQMLRNGGGVIVNMSSESGLEGSEGQSVYAATKAAAYNMTRSWAKELGRHGIRVVGIAPGIVEVTALRTEAYEQALAYTRGVSVEQLRAKYEDVSIPLGRVGKLKEVADTVCFLASARAGYIHGTTVNVSGGKSRG
jgi:sorbitol-6-phosphate 2-dehydrogenase